MNGIHVSFIVVGPGQPGLGLLSAPGPQLCCMRARVPGTWPQCLTCLALSRVQEIHRHRRESWPKRELREYLSFSAYGWRKQDTGMLGDFKKTPEPEADFWGAKQNLSCFPLKSPQVTYIILLEEYLFLTGSSMSPLCNGTKALG